MKELKTTKLFAIFIACTAFISIVALGGYWTHSINKTAINQQTSTLSSLSRSQAAYLERRLSTAFTATQILAYEIEHHNGSFDWFDEYSETLLNSIDGIESLQLAQDAIINKIFPLEGNETAIGLNILSNTQYKEEALSAIKARKRISVGPVKLVQGGIAVISRTPVYLYRGTQREIFWGFASAVINLNKLIEATQLKELINEGYRYNLSRINIISGQEVILSQSEQPLTEVQASADLIIPAGQWKLTISKQMEEQLLNRNITGYSISLLMAIIIAIGLYLILIQPQRLRILVKEKTKELEELAYKDPLTGLPNRRYLQNYLPDALYKIQKHQKTSAFIYFDLDNFKRINDTLGHDVGDQILAIVANHLNKLKSDSSLVIRLGGDEFGIILNNIQSYEEAAEYANTILDNIKEPIVINNNKFTLTTSLGIAMIPEHGHDLVTIMQNSDMALYQAKLEGKNQYAFYNESMRMNTYAQMQNEYDLDQAIRENEFELYYQPQFDLNTNKVCAAEALIRWNHPEKGLVFPDHFIPLAENSGKIVELGYWILENAIAYQAKRKRDGQPEILLHINLSSKQISDSNLIQFVQELLLKYQVPASSLGFEITETLILEDLKLAKIVLQTFKNMGICIAIDDFGTGYSSLAQLKHLPVNLLKIDRSFVMDLEHDINDKKIIEAIIAMAHKLHIKVLAEGIETKSQWEMLESFHCNLGQGYYVSKAVSGSDFYKIPLTIKHQTSNISI
ncbi:EAL domain-containing protein [Marinomonas sp. 5E14-1]|uniref:bifunctional diguanylate cyclase/phosphodiesterase n=1 Tax=Marinomonas sp. 5E14-1 TaxID=3153922 RepID=UPI0032670CA2